MAKLTEEQIRRLADQLMFDLEEDETVFVMREFDILEQQLSVLHEVNTDHTEPMISPVTEETSFLREDEPEKPLSADEVLRNAKEHGDNYLIVPRVVK